MRQTESSVRTVLGTVKIRDGDLPGGRRGRLVAQRGRRAHASAGAGLSVERRLAGRRRRGRLAGRKSRYATRRGRV